MPQFVLRQEALDDLREIAAFTVQRWGKLQKDRYLRFLDAGFHLIGANPSIGKACDDLAPGYRSLPRGRHMIFYRQVAAAVEIVRVLHREMDPERHLHRDD